MTTGVILLYIIADYSHIEHRQLLYRQTGVHNTIFAGQSKVHRFHHWVLQFLSQNLKHHPHISLLHLPARKQYHVLKNAAYP